MGIVLNIEWLRTDAWESPDQETSEYEGNDIVFDGTHSEQYYYTGVEESDHSAYFAKHSLRGLVAGGSPTKRESLAEYDAHPLENRWLETAVNLPKTQDKPRIMAILQYRLNAAKAFRGKNV